MISSDATHSRTFTSLLGFLSSYFGRTSTVLRLYLQLNKFWFRRELKSIKFIYRVSDAPLSYNIRIINLPTFNILDAVLSLLYFRMRYFLDNGKICVVRDNLEVDRKCYQGNLWIKRLGMVASLPTKLNAHSVNFVLPSDIWDHKRRYLPNERRIRRTYLPALKECIIFLLEPLRHSKYRRQHHLSLCCPQCHRQTYYT